MRKIELWLKYLKIEKFFENDEKYIRFLNFCKKENKQYLFEIDDIFLKKYSSEPSVGISKIVDIKQKLNDIIKQLEKQKTYDVINNCELDKIIFDINGIDGLNVGKFLNYDEAEIKELNFSKNDLEKIYDVCALTLPIEEIIKKIRMTFNDDELEILKDRYENYKTLEEIGAYKNISRERTRQIEIKLKQTIKHIFMRTNLNISLKIYSNFADEISLEKMQDYFGKEYLFLVNFLKKNEIFSRPYYIDFLELFLFDKRERFFKILYSLEFTNILTTENVMTIRNNFKNFKWVSQPEIEKIISKLGYEKHGKYYIQHSGYKDIIELYFVKLVLEPIRIDETTIESIIEDINTKLDYDIYINETKNMDIEKATSIARRLEGVLSRIDDIVMTDSRTYIHISKIKYDVHKFLLLKDKILSFNKNYIDSINIYKNFETELQEIGIFSDYVLYSLIKYHFAQELNLSTNRNSRVLTIGEQEFSRVDELEKYLEKENGVFEKNDIQEKLNYSNVTLKNVIDNSRKIITFSRTTIGLINLVNIDLEETQAFKSLVQKNDVGGNVFVPDIISKLNLDKKFKNFIIKNEINKYFVSSLIRYFFNEYSSGNNTLTKNKNVVS